MVAISALSTHAQTVWVNTNVGNTNFNDPTRWNNGAPDAADRAVFNPGAVVSIPVISNNISTIGIEFAAGAAAWTITGTNGSGDTLTIGSYGIINNSSNEQIIRSPSNDLTVRLGTATSFSSTGTGYLTFASTLTSIDNNGNLLTLNAASTSTGNSIAEIITGGGGLTKDGAGTWTMAANHNFTGATTLKDGVLAISSVANSGSGSHLGAGSGASGLVFDGGTLRWTTGSDSTNRAFTINNGKTATFDVVAGTLTLSGDAAATTGNLTKIGAGGLTLSGNHAYTGLTTVTAGTLTMAGDDVFANTSTILVNGGTLSVNSRDDTVGAVTLQSGSITGTSGVFTSTATYAMESGSVSADLAGSSGLNKTTGGTVTLSGTNTYTGLTNITAGTLTMGASNVFADTSTLTVNGGILDVNTRLDTLGTVTLQSGSITGGVGGTLTSTAAFEMQAGTAGAILAGSAGSIGLNKTTGGTVTLSGVNTYTGLTNITGGTLTMGANNVFADTSTLTVNGGTLDVNTRTDTLGTVTLQSGSITGGVGGTLTSTATYAMQSGSVSAILAGGVGLTKTTAGTVTLSGANTYTGVTTISQGTLSAGDISVGGGSSNLGNAASAVVLGDGSNTGTLSYTGNSDTYTRGFTVNAGGGRVDTTTAGQTLTIGTGNIVNTSGGLFTVGGAGNTTISSVIGAGAGGLTKTGAGTLTLSGPNTYSGVTTISQGTLSAGDISVGGGSSNLGNAATAVVLGDGSNTGTLSYTGNSDTYTRGFTVNAGGGRVDTTTADQTLTIGTGNIVNTSGGLFTVGGAGNTTISSVIGAGAGGLTKTGAGTLTLSGPNTYSGVTTISQGTLSAGDISVGGGSSNLGNAASAVVLGDGSNTGTLSYTGNSDTYTRGFTVNAGGGRIDTTTAGQTLTIGTGNIVNTSGGLFTVGGAGNTTISSVIGGGAGGLTKTGAGTLTLSGPNTYTGVTTISQGTLSAGDITVGGGSSNLGNAATAVVLGDGSNTGTLSYTGNTDTYTRGFTVNAGGGRVDTTTSGQTLTIGTGNIVNTSGGLLTVGGAGNTTISSSIGGGAGGLTKTGAGTLTLSGTNNYSGTTTVDAGTLIANGNNSLGAVSGAVTVNAGTLQLTAGTVITKSGLTTLSGTGTSSTVGALHAAGAATEVSSYIGNIILASDTTITAANNLLVVGDGLAFTNTLALGSNTLTLHTPVAPETTPIYPFAPGFDLDPANIIVYSKITDGALNKTGEGTATILAGSLTGNTFTGDTRITGGMLNLGGGTNRPAINSHQIYVGNDLTPGDPDSVVLQMGFYASPPAANNIIGTWDSATNGSSSSITIYEDGVFNMNKGSNGFIDLTLRGGHITGRDASANPNLTFTGSLTTVGSAQTAVIELGNLRISGNSRVFDIAPGSAPGGVDLRIDSVVQTWTNGGAGYTGGTSGTSLFKDGTGKMVLTNANEYAGITDINAGIINIQNGAGLGDVGSTLTDTGNGTVVRNNAQLQLEGGITVSGFESLTLNGTGIGSTGALRNVDGDNTYKGFVYLETDSRIQADAGTTLTIAHPSSVNSNIMDGLTAGQDLTVGGAGNTVINGGIANNVANISKVDGGTLTLAGSNTYTGTTTIASGGGVIKVTNNNGLSGTEVSVANGTALHFAQTAGNVDISVAAVAATINGSGSSGEGAIHNLNGDNSYGGAITLATGSLITAADGSSLTLSGGTSATTQTLWVGSDTHNGNITISGNMANGTGGLIKDGAGNLSFTGATGTVGAVTLSEGTMDVGGSSALATGAFESSAGTTLTIATGGTVTATYAAGSTTFGGEMAGGGTFVKEGAGTMVLNNGFTANDLDLTLNAGTMSLTDAAFSINTLTLDGGIFSLQNAQLSVGTIKITGSTVLDFNHSAGTFLSSGALEITAGVTITVQNWISVANDAASSSIWFAMNTINGDPLGGSDVVGGDPGVGQVTFVFVDGTYNGQTATWVSGAHNGWFNHEIRPTPEPATYGLLFLSGSLGLLAGRRYLRRKSAVATPSA